MSMGRSVLDCSRSRREGREGREGRLTVRGLASACATYKGGEAGRTRGRDIESEVGREGGRSVPGRGGGIAPCVL